MKAKRTFSALIPVFWVLFSGGLALAQPREPIRPGSILTLEACLNRSLGSHPLLKAVEIRTEAAEAYARNSHIGPNPTLTLQTENWRIWQSPALSVSRDVDFFLYGSQKIETAGKAARRREFADQQTALSRADTLTLRKQLQHEIVRSYWTALSAQTLLSFTSEYRVDLEQLVRYTDLRVKEGFSAESDAIRARLELQTVEAHQAAASGALERAKLELLKAMGETSFEISFSLVEPDYSPEPLLKASLETLIPEALSNRAEIARLRAKVETERAHLKLQNSLASPDLEFSAGYKRTGGYDTVLASVTIPLAFRNRNRAEIGRSEALLRSAEQELSAEQSYVKAEIQAALNSVQTISRRLETLQQDFLPRAEESRSIALVAYREGVSDLYKLIETQRARNEARLLLFKTSQDFKTALVELMIALGRDIK